MKKIFLALSVLVFSMLACSVFVGGPAYPDTPIPVSTADVQSLKDQASTAIADGAQTGTVSLQITEAQLTSYLAYKLNSQANPLITDPQVQLRNGQMQVFGKAQQGMFNANVSITMNVSVDDQGQPKIDITQADFGPLPAPQGLNDAVSSMLQEAFTGSLGPVATGFRLESITITDGVMTVVGRIK
jgi:hypothetical protein